jgi:hypothetical protein
MIIEAGMAIAETDLEGLRLPRRGRPVRSDTGLPAIKMFIGDWYVDELGVLTREIKARD